MKFGLYRCRNNVLLATDATIVSEHINRGYTRKAPVNKMPEGSVILIHNKPYNVDELLTISKQKTKGQKLDYNKPLSIMVDQLIPQ
ncbi:hypothetical protein [Psychrobacter sp.]|uniref:hypothetical protein n=1 Tax=Psychrobacter sp. TaxID=56811 RepID=UPI003BB1F7D9